MGRPRKSVNQNGVKIAINQELAAPDIRKYRTMYSRHPEQGLTFANLNAILLAAETGSIDDMMDFAEAMEFKDPQYRTTLSTRKQAVAGLNCVVEAASDSEEDATAAELVRRVVSGDFLADHYVNIMDAVGKGFSVQEIIWDYSSDGYLIPVDLKYRSQKFFTFRDEDGESGDGKTLFLKEFGFEGTGLKPLSDWPNNFIIHFTHGKSGLPVTAGSAYTCAYYYLIKQILLKDHLAFAEIFGTPPRIGYYPPGTPTADQDALLQMLINMGTDGCGIAQQGIDIKPIELNGMRGGGESVYQTLVRYVDDAITKVNLGQTLTTDSGGGRGSYALGAVHHAVRIDILKADARQLANTLNRYLVKPMVDVNFGPQARYPIAKFNVQENIDLTVAQSYIRTGTQLGVPIGVDHYRSVFSIPVPKKDEQLLAVQQGLAGRPPGSGGATDDPKAPGSDSLNDADALAGEKADPETPAEVKTVAGKPDGKNAPSDQNKKVPLSIVSDLPVVKLTLAEFIKMTGAAAPSVVGTTQRPTEEIAEVKGVLAAQEKEIESLKARRSTKINLIKDGGTLVGAEMVTAND